MNKSRKPVLSLRLKVFLVLLLVVFIITAANYSSSLIFTKQSISDVMEKELSLALDIADTVVTTKIGLLKSNAEIIAARLANIETSDLQQAMELQMEEFEDFISLVVYDNRGKIAISGGAVAGEDLSGEDERIMSAFNGAKVLSSPHFCGEDGDLIMHVYMPIDSKRILSASVPGMLFSDILSQYRLWQTGSIFMIDSGGTFVASNNELYPDFVSEQRNFIHEAQNNPEVKDAGEFYQKMISTTQPGSGRYVFEGKERLCVYKYVTDSIVGWRIGVVAPLDESPQNSVRNSLLSASVLLLLLGILISVVVSDFAVIPFQKIETQNENLERLNITVREQALKIQNENERINLLLHATPLA